MYITLANKAKVLSSRCVTLRVMLPEDVPHDIEFRVVPKLNHAIILGMPWLDSANPTIDWRARSLTFTRDNQDHTVLA